MKQSYTRVGVGLDSVTTTRCYDVRFVPLKSRRPSLAFPATALCPRRWSKVPQGMSVQQGSQRVSRGRFKVCEAYSRPLSDGPLDVLCLYAGRATQSIWPR